MGAGLNPCVLFIASLTWCGSLGNIHCFRSHLCTYDRGPGCNWPIRERPSGKTPAPSPRKKQNEVNSGSWPPQAQPALKEDAENPYNEGEDSETYDDGNTSSALAAELGDGKQFKCGRGSAASIKRGVAIDLGAAEGCDLLILVFDLFRITPIPNQSPRQRDFLLPGSVLSGEPGQSELNFIHYLSGIRASPHKGWNRL